jgi:hypothetical protein
MTTTYQIVSWRDIPASIKLRSGRERLNRPLSDRFQEAIDAAAMFDRTTSTDTYLEEWRSSEWQETEGDLEQAALRLVADLEAAYPDERLEKLKLNKGYE